MKRKIRSLFAVAGAGVALATASAPAFAQAPADQNAADTAWLNLQTLIAPMPLPALTPSVDPGLLVIQQANQFELGAQKAKAFYTAYPADSFAPQARKLEVVLALQGVQLGDLQYEQSALASASAYLANPANSPADCFDVALAMSVLSIGVQSTRLVDDVTAYAALADTLHDEFGDIPQVYSFYLGIMRTVDAAGASTVAQKLLTMSAPAWAKAEAQQTLQRASLVGKPIDLDLTTLDNASIQLGKPSSQTTVIYVWSNRTGTGDLAAFAHYKSVIPDGTRVIYVSLQSNLSTASAAEAQAPIAGLFCFDPSGFAGLTARTMGVQHTPYLYVLTKQGNLAGFGRMKDLPALLSTANNEPTAIQ